MKRKASSAGGSVAAPDGELLIRSRQRTRAVNLRLLREVTLATLAAQPGVRSFELGIQLVNASEMAAVNETFLDHSGSTDVITFDHSGHASRNTQHLHGEIFICLNDAVAQARQFRTSWQSELARYIIHGILHLRGYDDLTAPARRKMKREEARLLREIARQHPLSRLARRARVAR
ncbi:MAG TPA: rRNA maturation RNase YbeY [Verrucomicrobiae bacterium]